MRKRLSQATAYERASTALQYCMSWAICPIELSAKEATTKTRARLCSSTTVYLERQANVFLSMDGSLRPSTLIVYHSRVLLTRNNCLAKSNRCISKEQQMIHAGTHLIKT
jgi:hypothetical protein